MTTNSRKFTMIDSQLNTDLETEKSENKSSREKYLIEFVEKYRKFKSPTENQKLLIKLYDNSNRSDDDNKKLDLLLTAEIKKKQAYLAEKKFKDLINADKKKADNALKQKKIVLGAGVINAIGKGASVNGVAYSDILKDLIAKGFISDRDKNIFSEVSVAQGVSHE